MAVERASSLWRHGVKIAAAREAELETIACEVRPGSIRDAILHSAGANATHGLRRSNADKRRAVLILIEDEEWSKWADREIARRCAVSHDFVSRLRSLLSSDDSGAEPRTYQDRHGNVTQMRTAAIDRKPAEAPAQPTPLADASALSEPQAEPMDAILHSVGATCRRDQTNFGRAVSSTAETNEKAVLRRPTLLRASPVQPRIKTGQHQICSRL